MRNVARGHGTARRVIGLTLKDNLWVSLIAAMGLGVLAGLIAGLTRGR
jgi:hypothetical protein